MAHPPATLLLTRPDPQSRVFLADCEAEAGRSLPVVISPLLRIEPVGPMPDLDRYDTIVVTSGNAVRRLGAALSGMRVVTVGEKTAALAREHGADAEALGEDVEAFLGRAGTIDGSIVLCRGVHSRGDVADRFQRVGKDVDEAIIYDQIAEPLTDEALDLLTGDAPVVAPIFSPRTAGLLAANPITAPLTLLAISQATAEAWDKGGTVRIAERPDAKAMRALVRESV